MSTLLLSLVAGLLTITAIGFGLLMLLGLPVMLFESLFGRIGGRAARVEDRAARELFDRRLRDSHRR